MCTTYADIKLNANQPQKEIKNQSFRKAKKNWVPNFCVVSKCANI